MTCEHCGGSGRTEQELSGPGTYIMKTCIWCDGIGAFTRSRAGAYRRWRRIKIHHMRRGLCRP